MEVCLDICGSFFVEQLIFIFQGLAQFPVVAPGPVNVALYQGTYLQCNPPSYKPSK